MNKSEKKVSIIIICQYNSEGICEAIDSVLTQDIGLDNLEIIILCSFENKELHCILSQYEEKYSNNILLINCDKNESIGTLRNIALQYYSGEYIFFLPAGCVINLNTMSYLYEIADLHSADIVECNCNSDVYHDMLSEQHGNTGIINIDSVEQRKRMLVTNWEDNRIYSRLYKSEFLRKNNITFYMKDRDAYFVQLCKIFAGRYAVINEQLVTEISEGTDRIYDEAMSAADEQKRFLSRLIAIRNQCDYIEHFYEEFEYLAIKNILIAPSFRCQAQNDEWVRWLHKYFDELIELFPEFENNPYFLADTEMYFRELDIAKCLGIQYGCDEDWTIIRQK